MKYPRKNRTVSKAFGALLFAGLPVAGAYAQLVTAGSLLVNLDAATFNSGNTTWANSGTLGSAFDVGGSTPTRNDLNGAPGIFFDDSDFFVGPNSPATIDGVNPTVSIEVWTQQGYIRGEESLVAWGKRGGPDGTNTSFNYGTDDRWGAVGHWGSPDIGWGPNDPNGTTGVRAPGTPVEGQWHHLVYANDGITQRLYQDGALVNQENVSLNTFQNLPIQIAAQRDGDGTTVTGGLRLGGAISKVRIHSEALTDVQVTQNFNTEKALFGYNAANTYVKTAAQLPALPRNRYTFNGIASGADGTTVTDVIGGRNGQIRGPGVTVTATGVDLPGGDQNQGYIDLPNGVVSGTINGTPYTNASYEAWVTVQSNQNWSRIMDFGTSNNVEVTGPGGAGNGTNYVGMQANDGTNNVVRIERGGDAGTAVGGGARETQGNNMLGIEMHVVMVYDSVDQEWRWYQNGTLMEGFTSNGGPGTINDLNNWLGRSLWGGDNNLDGFFNEFRIYDYALTQDQVQGNFVAGPNLVNVPEPSTAALLGLSALVGLTRRRRK